MLAPHLAHSSLAKKRFAREAQAAAAVVHPNVLAIHHVQPNARLPFLVMPLVAGESLAERLATQGALDLKEVLRIGMQAAAGLAAAHDQGLVHRDVKPANILLEMGVERAVLTDFGLARAADDVSLTRWGIIAGTPQYMSPEQAKGEPLDGRSDLFSLGCVLYEMATGVSPFRTDSVMATMRRLVDDAPKAMASLNPELPPWFIAIVDRLLEKEPSRRFGSAKEVSELLAGCLAHLQQPASVPLPMSRTRSREVRETGKWWRHLTKASSLFVGVVGSCVVATLAMAIFYGLAAVDEPEIKENTRELHLPLRGIPEDREGWELIGPNAKECVQYEPEGLRITLPAGFPKERPGTGLRIPMPAHGDFEVTIHYEILAEPDQASVGPLPTKLIFQAQLKRKDWAAAAIARRVHSDKGIQFTTWTVRDNHDNSGIRQMKARQHTARAKVGRLRIVRTGTEAAFYAAEGPEGDFILLPPPRYMGEEDLKSIELVGSTGAPKATVDIRFTDLRVRTSVAPNPPKASVEALEAPEAPEAPRPPPRRHLWILLSLLTVGLLVVPLGIWLGLRRGRWEQPQQQATDIDSDTHAPTDAMAPLAFRCPGCGKPLKARAALAGKKIKCPGCGKAVRAPGARPSAAPPG